MRSSIVAPPWWICWGLRLVGRPVQVHGTTYKSPEGDALAACLGIKPVALLTAAWRRPRLSIARTFYGVAVAHFLDARQAVAVPIDDFDYPEVRGGSVAISRFPDRAYAIAALFEQARAGMPQRDFHAELGQRLGYSAEAIAGFLTAKPAGLQPGREAPAGHRTGRKSSRKP